MNTTTTAIPTTYPPAPKKTVVRWGKRQLELLVQLFAPHPYLYETAAAQQYPDERESKLYEIFEQIRPIKHDITIDGLKLKITSLYKQYQNEIRKIEKAQTSGTLYSPTVWWFEKLKMHISSGPPPPIFLPPFANHHHSVAPPVAVINPILVQPSRYVCAGIGMGMNDSGFIEPRPMEIGYPPGQDCGNSKALSDVGTIMARPMGYSMPTRNGMPSNEEIALHLAQKECEYQKGHNSVHHLRIVNYLKGYSKYVDMNEVAANPGYLKEYFYINPTDEDE